jgi:ferredoxin
MRIRVNREMCAGHARCNEIAPDLFPLDDEGYCAVSEVEVPPGVQEAAHAAVVACPEGAITVVG